MQNLKRCLLVLAAVVMTSGCTIGLQSLVEGAPFETRLAGPPFAEGVYCRIDKSEGELLVRSADREDENNCASFTWNAAERVFSVRNLKGEDAPTTLAFASLPNGLFLVQYAAPEEDSGKDGDDESTGYLLMAGASRGAVVAILPLPYDRKVADAAARYPGIRVSTRKAYGPQAFVAEGDADPVPVSKPDIFYVSYGLPADMRGLVSDLAAQLIADMSSEAREDAPFEHGIPAFVRDTAGAPDHPLSPSQQYDHRELVDIIRRAGAR